MAPTPSFRRPSSGSAVSLHTTTSESPLRPYSDNDFDDGDPPPEYSYTDDSSISPEPVHRRPPGLDVKPVVRNPGVDYYIDSRFDNNPAFLKESIDKLALEPPRQSVRIRGYHKEQNKSDKKKASQQVVDFDVQVDLTPLLYEDLQSRRAWQSLQTVSNFDKVKRGTVMATRAPGFGGSGAAEQGTPGADEWCRRYCADQGGLRAFTLERRVAGWDFSYVGGKLESLVNATNYRGHLEIDFPATNARIEIYNNSRINRWRLTRWIQIVSYVTFLWLFTWPWLFFRTRRFETLYVEWPMSINDNGSVRYTAMSEDQWYDLWCRPIQHAVMARRKGTLSQADLDDAYNTEEGQNFARGIRAGMEAVQRTMGWGADVDAR